MNDLCIQAFFKHRYFLILFLLSEISKKVERHLRVLSALKLRKYVSPRTKIRMRLYKHGTTSDIYLVHVQQLSAWIVLTLLIITYLWGLVFNCPSQSYLVNLPESLVNVDWSRTSKCHRPLLTIELSSLIMFRWHLTVWVKQTSKR